VGVSKSQALVETEHASREHVDIISNTFYLGVSPFGRRSTVWADSRLPAA
jgi:hypothetical protein